MHTRLRRRKQLAALAAGLAMAFGVAFGAADLARAGEAPLPLRNVLVQWRLGASAAQQEDAAQVQQGRVVIDSRRGVLGRADVIASSSVRTRSESSVQQVQVLNGGRARLYVGTRTPLTLWQFSGGPGPGGFQRPGEVSWQAWSSTALIDTGQGLSVTPRWDGASMVTIDIDAKVARPAENAPAGQTESSELMTRVQVPLDTWVAVARRGTQAQRSGRGVLSTEDLAEQSSELLELRVSLP